MRDTSEPASARRRQPLLGGLSATLGALAGPVVLRTDAGAQLWGAPRAELWPRWERHPAGDARTVDHGPWDGFLRAHLNQRHPSGIHRVRYRAVAAEDRRALAGYLGTLEATPISGYHRPEQLAFWVNLYNALTVRLVLDRYPGRSIREVKPAFWALGSWDMKLATVERERLTLNDIEHRILQPIWKGARLHYVVNCASLGCPNLPAVALTAENAERLMAEAAVAYVNHPRGAAFGGDRLRVSSIYDWYQVDFGGSRAGVLAHLRQHARGDLAGRLQGYDGLLDHAYDWSLNEA